MKLDKKTCSTCGAWHVPLTRIELPIRTVNSLNVSEHWRRRAKRAQATRAAAKLALKSVATSAWAHVVATLLRDGLRVVLTRHSRGKLDAHDGLPAALKHVVDGVADALAIEDNDSRIEWRYAQAPGGPSVTVEIFGRMT